MFKNHDHILFVLLFEVIELLSQVGDLPRLPFVLFAQDMYAFHTYADLIDKDEAGVVVLGAEAVEGFEVVDFLTDYSELLSFVVFLRRL